MNRVVEEDQVSMIMDDEEISDAMSGSNELVSGSNCFEHFVANGFFKIDQSSLESCIIQTSVSQKLQMSKRTRVVAIHKNFNSSRSWQIRAHSFRVTAKAVADKCGGDAQIRYAWYGASRDEICEIVTHGFSWRSKSAADSHSISLSPAKHVIDCVLSSTVDESGLRHLLLCRVILGKQEPVTGDSSNQFHPISSEFDSGVDDISAPTKYINWNSRLNFSILPCYIVSFEAPYLKGLTEVKTIRRKSSLVTFPTLISILSRFLDQSRMASLEKQYTYFKGKEITRPQMIQRVKEIAGNMLLSAIFNMYTNKDIQVTSSGRAAMPIVR
ncbi:probable inactive poly [ADP-ribose] polymerase SRO2 isoform X1 [Hibiscus syriacus]|uniref:probable inactive poly [ADP-ribose] polymerase SRO2 isoform X1 n=1 Tax=Hibiscus syriacus TaxID=106335 RepID=UPI001922CEFC|nr:probable inactive poly [ADP-ribose] polymerase SRO2 isoform X1 [Hibiscus syriacus]